MERVLEIISPAGFERFFADLAALYAAPTPPTTDPRLALVRQYGLEYHRSRIPELVEQYGLKYRGTPDPPVGAR